MTAPQTPFIAWDNRLANAVPVASSTLAGAAANLSDFRPYTSWKPSALPATVTVDCGAVKSADNLALFNHNLFSSGCSIEVHGSTDNFVTSDVTIATLTPGSDLPFILQFTSASYRYWRIVIMGGTTMPTLSVVSMGVALVFPVGLQYGFGPLDRKVFGQTNISEQGLPLGSAVLFEQWVQQLNFMYVSDSWIRSTLLPAWKTGLRGKPFLFAFDLADYPSEIYLVQTDLGNSDLVMSSAIPNYSSVQFTVKGIALP